MTRRIIHCGIAHLSLREWQSPAECGGFARDFLKHETYSRSVRFPQGEDRHGRKPPIEPRLLFIGGNDFVTIMPWCGRNAESAGKLCGRARRG